jgi:hypothetical protein
MNRRQFLLSAGAGAATLRAGFPEPSAIGANTAIDGYGLFDAIALIRNLGFPTIEIHPMACPNRPRAATRDSSSTG